MSSPSLPDQVEGDRLALVQYQLSQAVEQLEQPPPLNVLAINLIQDAAEEGFNIAATRLQLPVGKRADFLEVFDAVANAVSPVVPLVGRRKAMDALNTARVGFKHHGNVPDTATLRRHVAQGAQLLSELIEGIFGLSVLDLNMTSLVPQIHVRDHLERAGQMRSDGRLWDGGTALREALEELLADPIRRTRSAGRLRTRPGMLPSAQKFKNQGPEVQALYDWLSNVDRAIAVMAMGVDGPRLALLIP